jgi:hypothetical protein
MTLSPTSPQRLLEGGGTDYERQLLAASDGYVPSAAAAARVAAALRSAPAAARIAPPAPPPTMPSPTASGRLLKPGLAIVGGGILAALVASHWPEQRGTPGAPHLAPIVAAAPELAAPSAPSAAALPEPRLPEPRLPDTKQQTPKTQPATNVARRPPPVRKPPAARAQLGATDLAAEMRAIEHVQALLGWGQVQQAEAALRDYRASFPHGELALEADLSSVDVALAQGDLARARALARDLLERPGASRYRARLSSLLDTNAPAQGSKPRPR